MTCINIENGWLAFDTETSGLDTETERILTASLVSEFHARTITINPGIEIPAESIKIHGLTNAYIKEHGGDPKESLTEILDHINEAWASGVPIVAHNASYDFSILAAECRRHGLPEFSVKGPVLDTMVLARMLGQKKASLDACATKYGIVNTKAHSSESDALTTHKILRKMLESSARLRETSLRDLYTEQRISHRNWASDMQSYFNRIGKKTTVSADWPMKIIEESK